MNKRPTIREQIDACRPDSDDPHLPEHSADLAELATSLRESTDLRSQWEISQQNDRIVRGAMHDVSLPAGLESRLLAAVRSAQSMPPSGVEQALTATVSASEKAVVPAPAKANRRMFLKVVGGLATLAALILFGFVAMNSFQRPEPPITKDHLAAQVQTWLGTVDPSAMASPTKSHLAAFPRDIVLGNIARSGSFASDQVRITAFDVSQGSKHATLLVIPTADTYPVGTYPLSNLSGVSGGWLVRAWQRDGALYVLAVRENSDARLDQFIRAQTIG